MGCGSSVSEVAVNNVIIHNETAHNVQDQLALAWHLDGGDITEDEETEDEGEDSNLNFEQKLKLLQQKQTLKKRQQKQTDGVKQKDMGESNKVDPGSQMWNIDRLVRGDPNIKSIKSDHKVIRIFTSSTFTDTKHERNALMEQVYSKLDEFCKSHGFDFQVVDMRWGVREEAADDHTTTELCLKELRACQSVSTGPYFVTFLSHKYGFRPFPREINFEDFEKITQDVDEDGRQVLNKWFKKDENALPALYILQRISTVLPDLPEKEARNEWWKDFEAISLILRAGSEKYCKDPEKIKDFSPIAVTEREISQGLLNKKVNKPLRHCVWFKRNITDIKQQTTTKALSRFHECNFKDTDTDKKVKDAHEHMDDLQKRMRKKLPAKNIYEYDIEWQEGVKPENPQHKAYLNKLCIDFETSMKQLIGEGILQRMRSQIDDPLYREIAQHLNLCHAKCKIFTGRNSVLKKIHDYILGGSQLPLVVHGLSGCGKTSIMAMAARHAWFWTKKGQGVIMFRFIGTTQASSSLRPLLESLNKQMRMVFNEDTENAKTELKWLVEDFRTLMCHASKKTPLVIILDSLDQLDSLDGGRHLHWLPRQLPPHVKLVVSTLPQEKYGCFPRLRGLYQDHSNYIEVPNLDAEEVSSILERWLKSHNRKLTEQQQANVTAAYNKCPFPLVLKLNFDEARRWASYDPPSETVLNTSIFAVIEALFKRLEVNHGTPMVQHALGCVTASETGLSEGEIEDILSLNDTVLNDIYQFWVPPKRRLPPLLWVRVKNDLEEYLVHRGVDGTQVIYWYHRQFIEAARMIYLNGQSEWNCHHALAEYFQGKWAGIPKPYTNNKGEKLEELRYVDPQPLIYDDAKGHYNVRKLMRLPYHLIKSSNLKLLKSETLCNYEFLLAKLKACGYRNLREDFKWARQHYPEDRDLHIVMETLQLSQDALSKENPQEDLAGQLIGRIKSTNSTQSLIDQAKHMLDKATLPPEAVMTLNLLESYMLTQQKFNQTILTLLSQAQESKSPVLLPHESFLTPPGGRLMHKLAGHVDTVTDVDIAAEGDIVVTGSHDNTVKLWDIKTGEMTQAVDFEENVGYVCFCGEDEKIVVSCWKLQMFVIDVDKGTVELSMTGATTNDYAELCMPVTIAYTDNEEDRLVSMHNKKIDIWQLSNGNRVNTIDIEIDDWSSRNEGSTIEMRHFKSLFGYVVYAGCRSHQYSYFSVDNVKSMKSKQLFKPYAYNQRSPEPDYATDGIDHISALALIDSENDEQCHVIVCNGKNRDVIIVGLMSQKELRKVSGQPGPYMRNFYTLSEDNRLFFFTSDSSVGMWNVEKGTKEMLLEHPCQVKKVVTYDARMIATIAEDNVLRIWDKKKKPIRQDLSDFTDKVAVSSEADADLLMKNFGAMFKQTTGTGVSDDDTKGLLTSETTSDYWSPDANNDKTSHQQQKQNITSKFFMFKNARYIGVTHNVEMSRNFNTICVTIWDVKYMQCVCRSRIEVEADVVVYCVTDTCIVFSENCQLKLVELPDWKVVKKLNGKMRKSKSQKTMPQMMMLLKDKLLSESEDGSHLVIYDISTGEKESELIPSHKSLQEHCNEVKTSQKVFSQLQVTTDNTTLAAVYGESVFYVWDLESKSLSQVIDANKTLPGSASSTGEILSFHLSEDASYVIITADPMKVPQKTANRITGRSAIYNTGNGNISTVLPESSHRAKSMNADGSRHLAANLRKLNGRFLQMIGVDKHEQGAKVNVTGYVMSESEASQHANNIISTSDQKYCVTWCDLPKEKTIKYWGFIDLEWKQLGSFTPDKAVLSMALIDNGLSLIIDSAIGLIRLRLEGKDLDSNVSITDQLPQLYEFIDVNIPFPKSIGSSETPQTENKEIPNSQLEANQI